MQFLHRLLAWWWINRPYIGVMPDASPNMLLDNILPEILCRVNAWDMTTNVSNDPDSITIEEYGSYFYGTYVYVKLRGIVIKYNKDKPLESEIRINKNKNFDNLARHPLTKYRIWRFGEEINSILNRQRIAKEANDILKAIEI